MLAYTQLCDVIIAKNIHINTIAHSIHWQTKQTAFRDFSRHRKLIQSRREKDFFFFLELNAKSEFYKH